MEIFDRYIEVSAEDVASASLSDHAPVSLRLRPRREAPTGAPTPKWVAQSPRFREILADAIADMPPSGLGFSENSTPPWRSCNGRRGACVPSSGKVAQTPAERNHWILVGMRAARAADCEGVRKALCPVPQMRSSAGGVNMAVARTLLAFEHSCEAEVG